MSGLLVSIPNVARQLDIGRSTAYELVNRGEIRSVRIGGRVLVPMTELERYVAELCAAAGIDRSQR